MKMNPLVPSRCVGISAVTPVFCVGGVSCGSARCVSGSHPPLATKNLGDLVPAVDGVAAALTGHLVVTCGAYSALPHLVKLKDSAFITS